MKRHRVQHTSSPSLGRKPRTESHPGHHQQSLAAAWGTPAVAPPVVRLERASRPTSSSSTTATAEDALYAVDLFCGMGGWSCGAKQSGYAIALAIDSWDEALRIHQANHPSAAHYRMELGPTMEKALERLVARHVPAGARWHLHMSPPCTTLSPMHAVKCGENGFQKGMDTVMWSLRMVFKLKPTTWSFEQAPEREIMGMLRWLRHTNPGTTQFARVHFDKYGLPQTRIRMLAGSPCLMDPFLSDPSMRAEAPVVSAVLAPPASAVWLKDSVENIPKACQTVAHADGTFTNSGLRRKLRTVNEVAWTCVACHPHAYLAADFTQIRQHTPRESATLQSLPEDYILRPHGVAATTAQRAVGNCFPPLIARLLMGGGRYCC